MSSVESQEAPHEIIIVKRGHGDHEEGHHGGVWKIAFADFMTAMMCFFLVMWLINAANEQTKAAVASYFNPVKLIDRNASRKGLEDLGDGPRKSGLTADSPQEESVESGQGGDAGAKSSQTKDAAAAPTKSDNADARLFADPYAVLSEIAADTGVMQNVSVKGEGGAQNAGPATGASGGTSYRDPFAPNFWSQQMATPDAEASAERARIEGEPAEPGEAAATTKAAKTKAPDARPEAVPQEPLAQGTAEQVEIDAPARAERTEPAAAGKPDKADAKSEKADAKTGKEPSAAAIATAAELNRQLAEAFKPGDKLHDGVSVEATDKGVRIAITDRMDFGMFEIGSALPNRDLVVAMDKIGRIVNEQKGKISIQGHTDARPFRSETYDNWRLSTARAQAAYYMLVRGGVDERRIVEVSGFADRQPKDAKDPLAATNRRIEILLETDG